QALLDGKRAHRAAISADRPADFAAGDGRAKLFRFRFRRENFLFMTFAELRLIDPLLRAVAAEGYTNPTPIQAQAVPLVLAGRDVCGVAQTGTGKTAAFALPMLQLLAGRPRSPGVRALILAPTRELASQIGDSFTTYGRHLAIRNTVIFGGVGQEPQVA